MAQQAGFQQNLPPTIDIPLIGLPLQRGTGTGDQRYVNVIFEKIKNPLTGGETAYVIKRPGLENFSQPPAGAAVGRGLYYWKGSDKIYSVFGDKLYSNTTEKATLATSTGRVWFTETSPTSSTRLLIVSDGTDLYHIETNDTVTQIDENDDAQFPQANLGCVVFFDTYIFLGQSDGEIWNTDPDDFINWVGTATEDADSYGDELVALARQRDQIVALGGFSTEFYFDNGTTPSPLLRIQQNSLTMGCAHKNSVAAAGDYLVWVGQCPAQGLGGRSVWLLDNLDARKVSTPVIERFLNAEGSSISSCTAWIESVGGHILYVLNLSSANRTFVYDLEMKMWSEWSDTTGTAKFPGLAATSDDDGVVYVQDAANGRIYKLLTTIYQDSASNFPVILQTDNYDFGTPFAKFQDGLWLVGDNGTSTISVAEADDDYATFNTGRDLDITATRKFLPEGGMFFSRAYKLTYTQNAPLRLQKLVLKLTVGNS